MITIEQIRAGRAMARLTQAQLAAQAGISTTAMNNIEHGADANTQKPSARARFFKESFKRRAQTRFQEIIICNSLLILNC